MSKSQWKEVEEFGLHPKDNRNTRIVQKGVVWRELCSGKMALAACEKLGKSKTRIRHVPVRNDYASDSSEAMGRKDNAKEMFNS